LKPIRSLRRRADPAPPKWRWRLERLWLTPLFRALVRKGLPALALAALAAWWAGDATRVAAVRDGWDRMVRAVEERPEFRVDLLRIEGASEQVQADIIEVLPIDLPLSQFALDIDGLRTALQGLDPVREAEVRVQSGGVLLLRIVEREPAVAWMDGARVTVLDAEGHRVASLDSLEAAGPLPVIAGEGADAHVAEALRLFAAAAPISDRLLGLTRVGMRRWDVLLLGGQRIALPEDRPAAALDGALAMHAAKDLLDRDVRVVDLRLPDRPVLRLSPEARAELRRLQDLERLSYTEER
jgi:cell division protein FtsQ